MVVDTDDGDAIAELQNTSRQKEEMDLDEKLKYLNKQYEDYGQDLFAQKDAEQVQAVQRGTRQTEEHDQEDGLRNTSKSLGPTFMRKDISRFTDSSDLLDLADSVQVRKKGLSASLSYLPF